MKKIEDIIEEVRTHMEQNKAATGSVYAATVIATLYKLGYGVAIREPE